MLPPWDFAKQAPEFDILGAAYVVRDADHLIKIVESDVSEEVRKTAREKLKVEILAPAYYGARHVNLKGNKKVSKPEDLASVELRMPGGESWQFLGKLGRFLKRRHVAQGFQKSPKSIRPDHR